MNVVHKKRFTQVYSKGWDTIRDISDNPLAMKVYAFFAKHCDHMNAIICPAEVLAEEFSVHPRTVWRAIKWLEERDHIVIVKAGASNVYVLDPTDLWKNYEQYKGYCSFVSRTLAPKSDALKKRLTHVLQMKGKLPKDAPE